MKLIDAIRAMRIGQTSVGEAWSAYVESANQIGHGYLGLVFGLPACLWLGWWGAVAPLALSAAKEAHDLLAAAGEPREGARRWDSFKDWSAHLPTAAAAGCIADGSLWWACGFLGLGLVWAAVLGVVWQLTSRDARG